MNLDGLALAGEVRTDEAALAHAAQDWGHLVQARPVAVVRPASAADVAAVLAFAAARDIPVAARGAGHSPFGQGQASSGIVLDMTSMHAVHTVSAEHVVVDAGARWQQVLAATLPRGLTPPVLTDYLEVTVGGTLTLGGIGGASHHHGTQTDTVAELDVITGDGTPYTCSPHREPALFDAIRSGLGQCGVITRATIRLRPAHERARRWLLYYDTLDALLADQRTVVRDGRFDYLEGQLVLADTGTWRYLLEACAYYTPPHEPEDALLAGLSFDERDTEDTTYHEFLDRMAEGEALLRAEGSWFHPHPWLNVFLPDEHVGPAVTAELRRISRADLGDSGLVMLYPVRADRLRTPLLRVPEGELVWLFAVLRTGHPYAPADNQRMIDDNLGAYRRAREAGGTAYPANMLPMSTADWRRHFGPAWDTLRAAKSRFDPSTILSPGHGVFPAPNPERTTT